MVTEFYGFPEDPFAPAPDPKFLFLTEGRKRMLDTLVNGIKARKGFFLVTGEAGTGKTSFIRQLLPMLDAGTRAIVIDEPSRSFDELLERLLGDLGVPVEDRDKSAMLWQFNEHLQRLFSLDETLLICVDQAHEMSEQVMEELRLLANPDPRRPGQGVVQELFVGNPEIEHKLSSSSLRQLLQRISVTCRLEPLSESEARQVIAHRLDRVGSDISDIFTPDAVDSICRHSQGVPRFINILCSVALSAGYALSMNKVDGEVVEGVSSILRGRRPGRRQQSSGPLGGVMHHLGDTPVIMKVTYALWAYSLAALAGFFCLKIFF